MSEPEPDLSVFPPGGAYRTHHPTQASLLIEVSNTSLRRDLTSVVTRNVADFAPLGAEIIDPWQAAA